MNSLSQLSRRYLRRQWKRTIFTSLGIVMATALFAGLALLLTSFVNMYVESESANKGSWHYHISGLTMEQAEQLQANIRVRDSELIATSKYLGKLIYKDSDGLDLPEPSPEQSSDWLLLRDISQMGDKLSPYPMSLLSGRLPENSSEILLNASTLGFFQGVEIGQEIELDFIENGDSSNFQPFSRT
ncbi:MAG: hypothetical protein GX028_03165, partial [Clostridiaceae bacterium]|nr:hypothetical protein [Clostridiaceae bacterium]